MKKATKGKRRTYWIKSTDPATPGLVYEVERHRDGLITCSCKGFRYRRECKHVKRAAEWKE